MIIKIYGERNTGTNYLMQLLRNHLEIIVERKEGCVLASNFPAASVERLEELGWKHRLIDADFLQKKGFERESILLLTLTKNPYSWLLSLHKRPYLPIFVRSKVKHSRVPGYPLKRSWLEWRLMKLTGWFGRRGQIFLYRYSRWCVYEKLNFSDFIRNKWFSRFDEGKERGYYKNAIKLWNEKNKAYLELAQHYDVMLLTYEELLASPEIVVHRIANHLKCIPQEFKNVYEPAKQVDKIDGQKNYQFYYSYYLKEEWRKKLSSQDIQWISSQLDQEVMQAFGYQIL